MNAQIQTFHYLKNPSIGPDGWALRVQFQLLFPEKKQINTFSEERRIV
jgi:hypothetical protein